ncbi:hypothetical protein, partial [Kocuria sp. CCUG 69068]|uniref:hypothetical protein n=1 Tax=Kocuria sp. CCUG 69068 TaxID=2043138 RepID=UPI001E399F16
MKGTTLKTCLAPAGRAVAARASSWVPRVAQPVGVVDAQAVDEALVDPPLDLRVGLLEDLRVLDAHAR